MAILRSSLSAVAAIFAISQLSNANPSTFQKRDMFDVPSAGALNGTHILLNNDVDSSTPKNAFVLLSNPQSFNSSLIGCSTAGDGIYVYSSNSTGGSDLVLLLNNNAPAHAEVSGHDKFWVGKVLGNDTSSSGNCTALNKSTGSLEQLPCTTNLPAVCNNLMPAKRLLLQVTSRQVTVNTPVGEILGWRDQNSFRFQGIPYAEPPVGDLRFAAPVPKAPFNETWSAINYGNVCPQDLTSGGFKSIALNFVQNEAQQSEDCLFLNVFTPSLKGTGEKGLPVMVYIHGGSFVSGSGSRITQEPGNMVSRGGVVSVTLNYRLGILGFMEDSQAWPRSSVSGNQAIHDQILALQWVQKNIASFGGDPSRVTIYGQSAGASSLRALLSAPSAFGLYHNVIAQSDPIGIPFKTPQSAGNMTSFLLEALKCSTGDLTCLRSRTTEQIMMAQTVVSAKAFMMEPWTTPGLIFRPSIDGEFIPADFNQLIMNGKYNTNATVMWGTVNDEAGSFVDVIFPTPTPGTTNVSAILGALFPPEQVSVLLNSTVYKMNTSDPDGARNYLNRLGTDYYFFCPLRYLSREIAKNNGTATHNYRFHRGRDEPFAPPSYCSVKTGRVCHSADIQPVHASGAAIPGYNQTGYDARFARQSVDRFTAFAKTGNPNPTSDLIGVEFANKDVSGVEWLVYNDTNPLLELNINSTMSSQAENDGCSWLESNLPYQFIVQANSTATNSTNSANHRS